MQLAETPPSCSSGDRHSDPERKGSSVLRLFRRGVDTLASLDIGVPLPFHVCVVTGQGRPLIDLLDIMPQPLRFAPGPHKATSRVKGVGHTPVDIISFSWANSQWRLRAGFSRTLPPPREARAASSVKLKLQARLSFETRSWSCRGKSGRPSG